MAAFFSTGMFAAIQDDCEPLGPDGSKGIIYDPNVNYHSQIKRLESNFESALQHMEMFYQPIIRATDLSHYGYEALLRSNEPTLPDPNTVLDAAEQLNRLPQLGRTIRNEVAREFVSREGQIGYLFVNMHALDLLDSTLCSRYSPLARIAQHVVLEITERTSLQEVPQASRRLAELRSMGYKIAIDDLGAGHSRMNHSASLKTDYVKLDRSLVKNIDRHPPKQQLVMDITAKCHDHDICVVAEGIEKQSEAELLMKLGCDLLQGYFFARPAPFSDSDS